MWASNIPKTIEKKSNIKQTLPLEKYLANARAKFIQDRKQIPQKKLEIEDLKHKLTKMIARHEIRLAKDTQLMIEEIEKEVEIRQSMQRENEYEQIIAPYLAAYNQRVEISDTSNNIPRNINAPGCGNKRETIDTYVQQYDATASRQTAIVNEYLMQVTDEPPKLALHTRDECPLCNETLMLINSKAIMTCPSCGYSVTYLDATMSSMSYSDDVEFSSFSYKRINHFNEWLQQVQAKENFDLSDENMQNIMEELYKQRITDISQVTQKKVREILKILKLRKAYEHVAHITCRLTGAKPMRIPPEAEETCRLMFIAVQPAFEKHCPKDRKNFLSYAYCLFKFFQLLGYDQFLDSFSLLKGRDKLIKQDEIFQKICEELDWDFLPSV